METTGLGLSSYSIGFTLARSGQPTGDSWLPSTRNFSRTSYWMDQNSHTGGAEGRD
jgi:hypothetical protein